MPKQLHAERAHVLRELVYELGGLAHDQMGVTELDRVIDNMLSKGVPHSPSENLVRWLHTHRKLADYKIAQILGAHVDKTSSIIPECLGKFYDTEAVECKACLDGTICSMKTRKRLNGQPDDGSVKQSYTVGKKADANEIQQVLSQKWGQISRTLAHGVKVILDVDAKKGSLRVLSVSPDNSTQSEDITMATKKGSTATTKPAAAPVVEDEEEDLGLDLTSVEDEAEEGLEEEVEAEEPEEEEAAPVAPKAKKATAAVAPAAEAPAKAKKEPKPKPVLNKAQQQFQDELDKRAGEDKQKYSAAVAKKLNLTVDVKNDARIDHMLRCMAIKKHLAGKA